MNRPKREWFVGKKRRAETAKESKSDLKNIKQTFEKHAEESGKADAKKRKRATKAAKKSAFAKDAEKFPPKKGKLGADEAKAVSRKKFFKRQKK